MRVVRSRACGEWYYHTRPVSSATGLEFRNVTTARRLESDREVVVVEGNFGIRVQQVVSRQERLRTLN